MSVANKQTYLIDVVSDLWKQWPDNQTVNIICHGHSVPSGYFSTPVVKTFDAYPSLLHRGLSNTFPYAVTNVIVTAIGGEHSKSGATRMDDVLAHKPRVMTIDYALNDRGLKLKVAEQSWRIMIEKALQAGVKVILLTPTADTSGLSEETMGDWKLLQQHAGQVRSLASEYEIGLVDSLKLFEQYVESGGEMTDLLSWINHPSRKGHEIIAKALLRWFKIFLG